MIPSLLTLLTLGGLSGPGPAFHSIAFVSDPVSPGVLGDGLLSLSEAIRLHNGTLLTSQLSAAEQAQLSLIPGTGGTTDVTWIDIDPEVTPLITVLQDLETIVNTPFGLLIRGSGGEVTIDFSAPGLTRGFHSTSNGLILQNLRLQGGPSGLEVAQADASGQSGCTATSVAFENQAQFGLRVVGTSAGGVGRLILEHCAFVNVPSAVELDETLPDRDTIFEARDVRIVGASSGFDLEVGTGGTARFTFDRVILESSSVGIDLVAPQTNGRPTLVEGLHTRVRAPVCARFDGAVDAVTWVDCAMWNLLATPGGTALELGGPGARVYGDLDELRSVGDVTITTGAAPLPLRIRNMRGRDGAVTLSTAPAQPLTVTESRFVDCVTETAGTGVIAIDGSSFEGGAIGASSPAGLLQATGCFLANAGPGVAASQSLPQPQLGSIEVSPDDAPYGGPIQFAADLPAGLVCGFVLGTVPVSAPALPPPFHVYVDLTENVFLPGFYIGQQSTSWTVPSLPVFFGRDLIVQAAVLPFTGLQAPPLQLPPGWRFVIR